MNRILLALLCVVGLGVIPRAGNAATASPDSVGQWSAPFYSPVVGVHAALLPTGEVLYWSYPGAWPGSEARLYDYRTGTFRQSYVSRDIFCAGFSFLGDGTLYVTGGDVLPPYCPDNGQGLPITHRYDSFTNTWTQLADMTVSRWYPTNITMPDGSVLIMSGLNDTCGFTKVMERFTPGVGLQVVPGGFFELDLYPRLHILSNGKLFHAGPDYTSFLFDPVASNWTRVADHLWGGHFEAPSVLLPGFDDVAAVFGGGRDHMVTNVCEKIDMRDSIPRWEYFAPMHYARDHLNAVILPDGLVMVVGGGLTSSYEDPVMIPEMYNAATDAWYDLPPLTYGRMYHSTALLLPDGRVLVNGQDDGPSAVYAEIYEPAYLFKGDRPTITAMPGEAQFNSTIPVVTPDADSIETVVLMGLSTVTHSYNNGQRRVPLQFTQLTPTGLSVTMPNANLAPPGYYMLFILDHKGVPSTSQMIRLGTALADVAPPPVLRTFSLRAAPNPVFDHSVITYALPWEADVRVSLVDVSGRLVRELDRGRRPAGSHRLEWDGRDRHGVRVASGRYYCVMRAGAEETRQSLVVIR